MVGRRIVIDTNVLVAGLTSARGSSFRLLRLVGTGRFEHVVSVPLVVEYEARLQSLAADGVVRKEHVELLLDYFCAAAIRQPIFYLWRPRLADPKDDMVLELAVAAGCETIVTFNVSDFRGSESFGIRTQPPGQFLRRIGEYP